MTQKAILKIKAERFFVETYANYPELRVMLRKGTEEQIVPLLKTRVKVNNVKEFNQIVMEVRNNWVKKNFKQEIDNDIP